MEKATATLASVHHSHTFERISRLWLIAPAATWGALYSPARVWPRAAVQWERPMTRRCIRARFRQVLSRSIGSCYILLHAARYREGGVLLFFYFRMVADKVWGITWKIIRELEVFVIKLACRGNMLKTSYLSAELARWAIILSLKFRYALDSSRCMETHLWVCIFGWF